MLCCLSDLVAQWHTMQSWCSAHVSALLLALQVCPRLRLLRLAGCPSINSVAELVLAAVMPRLKTADDTELTDDWEQAGGACCC